MNAYYYYLGNLARYEGTSTYIFFHAIYLAIRKMNKFKGFMDMGSVPSKERRISAEMYEKKAYIYKQGSIPQNTFYFPESGKEDFQNKTRLLPTTILNLWC